MSKKVAEENGGMNLGEIGMIRNILMGEKLSQYEQKFLELQEEIASLKSELLKEIEQNKSKNKSALDKLEEKTQNQFSKVESTIKNKNEALGDKMDKALSKSQKDLGEALVQLGQKIMGS